MYTCTFEEVMDRIARDYDPDLICELLSITTTDLLERFEDRLRDEIILSKFLDPSMREVMDDD